MSWRFRRSFKLAPGIRMNVGVRGMSWSLGPRGASINVSRRGTFANVGISGTGLSHRARIGGSTSRQLASTAPTTAITTHKVAGEVAEDGVLVLRYENGAAISPDHYLLCVKQHRESLLDLLQREAEVRNHLFDSLVTLHQSAPDPRKPLEYQTAPFSDEAPSRPLDIVAKPYRLLDRLMKSRRARVDEENLARQRAHEVVIDSWERDTAAFLQRKEAHEQEQLRLRHLFEHVTQLGIEGMEEALQLRLQSIEWPKDTNASFEVRNGGQLVLLDVDLPEIEDMPRQTYVVLKREMRLATREASDKRVRETYMRHVHAIGLRLLGEVFATLPSCERAVVSGYSRRPSKLTGQTEDEYLYSLRASRAQWLRLNFDNLASIDPVAAFDGFDSKRNMTKSGVFSPVEPFGE
jgi:hypothetical protein